VVPHGGPEGARQGVLPHEGGRGDARGEGARPRGQGGLLRGDPERFYTTPHYDGYAYVLVRLPKVDAKALAELVEDAWRLTAPAKLRAAYEGA
jgi:hypothetical protein